MSKRPATAAVGQAYRMGLRPEARGRQRRHSQVLIRSVDQHRLLIFCRKDKLIQTAAHPGTLGKQKQQQVKKLASKMADHAQQHQEQQQQHKKLASKLADHAQQHQEQQQQQQQQEDNKLASKMADHTQQQKSMNSNISKLRSWQSRWQTMQSNIKSNNSCSSSYSSSHSSSCSSTIQY